MGLKLTESTPTSHFAAPSPPDSNHLLLYNGKPTWPKYLLRSPLSPYPRNRVFLITVCWLTEMWAKNPVSQSSPMIAPQPKTRTEDQKPGFFNRCMLINRFGGIKTRFLKQTDRSFYPRFIQRIIDRRTDALLPIYSGLGRGNLSIPPTK